MWLVYLRYDDEGDVCTYHAGADNKAEAMALLAKAGERGPTETARLVEYAVFYSGRKIRAKEAPNFHMDPGFLRKPARTGSAH